MKKTTIAAVAALALLIILEILSLIIKSFVMGAILHIYLQSLLVAIIIKILHKCFKEQLTDSMNNVIILCGCVLFLDLVVIDTVRFILSNGISTILFLPACLPACFMIIMNYSTKDTGKDKKDEKRLTYIIGIPLLILSLYFEVISFVNLW